jgi:hypothetical protein
MIEGLNREFRQVNNVRGFLDTVLDGDIGTKRIASLGNATLGAMTCALSGIAVIGTSLAQTRQRVARRLVLDFAHTWLHECSDNIWPVY